MKSAPPAAYGKMVIRRASRREPGVEGIMIEPFQNAYVLTGPTGSGKTELGLQLAERLGAEIISMDSMALYRGMDIGTAKASVEERKRVPHHMVDVLDPWESASVAWWIEKAS